jgi:hypothetical protein
VIIWEDAMHDEEPRDKQADTSVLDHGYWSMGPEHDGTWGLDLIEQDESLAITFEWSWRLASEESARATAEVVEASGQPPSR